MRITLIAFFITAVLLGCKKDDELPRSIFDLKIAVSITDTNGMDSLYFDVGEDIVFHISITNPVDKKIGFYYDDVKCDEPTFGFDVYDYKDNFIGNILPGEVNCSLELEPEVIEPGEVMNLSRSWFQSIKDTSGKEIVNEPLPQGSYYMKYNMQLVDNFIDGRDDVPARRSVIDKIYFSVK